jgi:hypothetical protein
MRFFICIMLVILAATPLYAVPVEVIGHIHSLNGTVSILRAKATLPGAVGTPLNSIDIIRTGKPGAVGIVLTDGTTFSLGPNSELAIKDYAFNPKENKFSLVVRMAKGTFVYLSGLIGKLSPNAVKLDIPDATIGVRGTKLLVDVQGQE